MDADKLVRMANHIAANFDGGSDESQAVTAVTDHIQRFWSPLMLKQVIERWRAQPEELTPRAAQAIAIIAEQNNN